VGERRLAPKQKPLHFLKKMQGLSLLQLNAMS
jgi:hypothetical protein